MCLARLAYLVMSQSKLLYYCLLQKYKVKIAHMVYMYRNFYSPLLKRMFRITFNFKLPGIAELAS